MLTTAKKRCGRCYPMGKHHEKWDKLSHMSQDSLGTAGQDKLSLRVSRVPVGMEK